MIFCDAHLITSLDDAGIIITIIQSFLGIVFGWLKHWIPSEKEMRQRTGQLRETKIEAICCAYENLLEAQFNGPLRNPTDYLRGNPPKKPDLIATLSTVTVQSVKEIIVIENVYKYVKMANQYFIVTLIIGFLLLLLSILFPAIRGFIFWTACGFISSQIIVVLYLRTLDLKLEKIEDVN